MYPRRALDDIVKEDVCLLKVDVEGFEPRALKGAAQLFSKYKVENVLMEYSPGVYEVNHMWQDYHEMPEMLLVSATHRNPFFFPFSCLVDIKNMHVCEKLGFSTQLLVDQKCHFLNDGCFFHLHLFIYSRTS
jgi:hypothetical protein